MRTSNIKVKITIPIPYNKPDDNGVVYSEEAVEKAVNYLHTDLPIVYRDSENEIVIGVTTGKSHIVTWDFDNQVCNVTVEDAIRFGGTECIVNKIEDGVVKDFEIVGIGLSK